MKKKNWILPGLIGLLVAAGLLIVGFSSHASAQNQKNKSTCCCHQKMRDCAGKKNSNAPGEMIMETLSRQFLSLTASAY